LDSTSALAVFPELLSPVRGIFSFSAISKFFWHLSDPSHSRSSRVQTGPFCLERDGDEATDYDTIEGDIGRWGAEVKLNKQAFVDIDECRIN
jgi:hypothetical protein